MSSTFGICGHAEKKKALIGISRLLVKDAVKTIASRPEIGNATSEFLVHFLNGGLSILLLLLGGTFAGLTLA